MESNAHEVTRRYAKYVFLDVVQFSKRSAEAQSDVIRQLNEIVRESLHEQEVKSEDCILIPTGDGMCIALISPDLPYDSHIRLTLKILQLLDTFNEVNESETRKFKVRIGINQNTDIIITDINDRRNIAGAGINMAARIMDKADGNQILVSQTVFDELHPSEKYESKFRLYNASGKHNIKFSVHQYIDSSHTGLDTEIPSAFVVPARVEKKLPEETAHYFAQCLLHRQDLIRIKAQDTTYWDNAAIVLLRLLAKDSFRLSKKTEYDEAPSLRTYNANNTSFDEQYKYYKSQDFWVLHDAKDYVINKELELSDFSDCFEYGEYQTHYEFLNAKGKDRLKSEWSDVWEHLAVEKATSS